MAHHEPLDVADRDRITGMVIKFLTESDITASELARRAGVAQSFVWHVTRGNFAKMTPRLRRLVQYVRMKSMTPDADVQGVNDAIERFMASGGDLAVLRSGIDMLTLAIGGDRGGR